MLNKIEGGCEFGEIAQALRDSIRYIHERTNQYDVSSLIILILKLS